MDAKLSQDLRNLLTGNLQYLLNLDVWNSTGALIEFTIRRRTERGVFLNAGYTKTYSKGWKRRRVKRGRQVSHVDLFFEGNMLKALHSKGEIRPQLAVMSAGYITGLSEVQATNIAGFHNLTGAGKNRIIREFIGLTQDEADSIITRIEKDLIVK